MLSIVERHLMQELRATLRKMIILYRIGMHSINGSLWRRERRDMLEMPNFVSIYIFLRK